MPLITYIGTSSKIFLILPITMPPDGKIFILDIIPQKTTNCNTYYKNLNEIHDLLPSSYQFRRREHIPRKIRFPVYVIFSGITLFRQVVPSAYSLSIVSYNSMWELSLQWGLVSKRPIPADYRSVTLLRTYLCHHSRRVVIHCHYAIVVPCIQCTANVINHLRISRILSRLFIFPVYSHSTIRKLPCP